MGCLTLPLSFCRSSRPRCSLSSLCRRSASSSALLFDSYSRRPASALFSLSAARCFRSFSSWFRLSLSNLAHLGEQASPLSA
ncbi:hypothetical protein BT67DRAFT_444244 [Trichocladium antarcticum]|uniref:Uncharacterized protein n=1 Tax=Trichocladium antarcticum TaxID=1450529 RepID=A0AAN6ZBY9_9PEZI|nr:hypothetical protein BT67DRAFT_444244 [Trichocladium antarcticum]